MSVFMIVQVAIDDPDDYQNYTRLSGPLIKKYGGNILVRGGNVETLEGDQCTDRIVVVEFPNAEAVRSFYHSEEYQQASLIRRRCSNAQFIIVDCVASLQNNFNTAISDKS